MTGDKRIIVVHYDEIALKGKNQKFFIDKLIENIKNKLENARVKRGASKIIITNVEVDSAVEVLKLTPGIATITVAYVCRTDLDEIKEKAVAIVEDVNPATFKIETTRSFKQFPLSSMEVSREVGGHVLKTITNHQIPIINEISNNKLQKNKKTVGTQNLAFLLKVDVHNPELMIKIEIENENSYVQGAKIEGVGGLPVGTAGKVMCLLSGGIDSPVAGYEMMKRGAKVEFIHFHNRTINKSGVEEKIRKLVAQLEKVQGKSRLHIIPFEEYQKEVIAKVPADMRMIVYRRIMFKIAEGLMDERKAKALITGDSLAQVASQTLENMNVIYQATDRLKLTPLIGKNKREIISIAQKIGTYEISIEPYEDCCSFMIAKHPITKAKIEDVLAVEEGLRITPKYMLRITSGQAN